MKISIAETQPGGAIASARIARGDFGLRQLRSVTDRYASLCEAA